MQLSGIHLTDNIIHFVLARLPDAPPGTKGVSLFHGIVHRHGQRVFFLRTVHPHRADRPIVADADQFAHALLGQRGLRVRDASGAFGDATFKAGGLYRNVLGKESRQRNARGRIAVFA
jgi:hypothetical protein